MSLGCESELSQWRGRKQWVILFGTRFYVSFIHSIRSLELFVSLVFTACFLILHWCTPELRMNATRFNPLSLIVPFVVKALTLLRSAAFTV